ncbi:MAG: putative metal-binding motif-containing protein, partial [Myxococcota bacterium]
MLRYLPLPLVLACTTDIQVGDKPGTAPAAVINAPDDGSVYFSNELVEFVGTIVDGDGLDDIATVFWTSTIDGELANLSTAAPDSDGVTRVPVVLTPGNHGITLRVTDLAGMVSEDGIDVAVGEARQEPTVVISAPENFDQYYPGDPIALSGSVADDQQAADTLQVAWVVVDNSTDEVVAGFEGAPTPAGATSASWTPTDRGNFRVGLQAIDDDSHTTLVEVLVVIEDPDLADLDGDGFAVVVGDCDDTDPSVNPDADEVCGDLIDQDCNDIVDDKDLDLDSHIDAACVNYVGPNPIDDCDDADPTTFAGAYELPDGVDNDCDGRIDNGGPAFDDDGDCYCEVGPCLGSDNTTCGSLSDGDCDDEALDTHPGALDDPDRGYRDENCDNIDGDLDNAVFLDPIGGNDGNSGLDPFDAVLTLPEAFSAATAAGVDWVLIAQGTLAFTGPDTFAQGVSIAGGYESAGWSRSAVDVPTISVPSTGKHLLGWVVPTEWHQVRISAAAATSPSGSSIALTLVSSAGLTLVDCDVAASNGADGNAGTGGVTGGGGFGGARGGDGCEDSS